MSCLLRAQLFTPGEVLAEVLNIDVDDSDAELLESGSEDSESNPEDIEEMFSGQCRNIATISLPVELQPFIFSRILQNIRHLRLLKKVPYSF